MATIREVKKELRHREWAEEIAECQSSGMKIRNWCRMKGISCQLGHQGRELVWTGHPATLELCISGAGSEC